MTKRKIRCPHCGDKGYRFYDLMERKFQKPIIDYDKSLYIPEGFLRCEFCEKQSNVYYNGNRNLYYDICSFLVFIGLLIVIILGALGYFGVWAVVASIWIFLGCGFVLSYYSSYYNCLLPVIQNEGRKTLLKVHPNCKVELENSKYIRNMWVYGLKFETETKNVKFKERFEDGLVPAQFYPAEKGCTTYEIRIIGREFVPDEVLFDGAEFLIEDIDGIFIAKGKITKTDLYY